MKKFVRYKTLITPILEICLILVAFVTAYFLRWITDGIPFVQLRIPYITFEQFFPFIIFGCLLWWAIFSFGSLYSLREDMPIFEEMRLVIKYSLLWFFIYISVVYLSTWFLFKKEIPRLIIFYVYILGTTGTILIRYLGMKLYIFLSKAWYIDKKNILIVTANHKNTLWVSFKENESISYIYLENDKIGQISDLIRSWKIDAIISTASQDTQWSLYEIISMARIYGIPFAYPKFIPWIHHFTTRDWFSGWIPVIEITSLSINFWELVFKRVLDILISVWWIILLSPLYILIWVCIKIEDPSWPILFKNRRIWQNGKIFDLYKFRYMYWKYSIKEAYGVDQNSDEAIELEESLKKQHDTREWPLYKIQDDPRRMKFWKIIERLSLDELPQLFNVLKWEMSLIGPRPHQPREVDLYDEEDKQVLIIKPWISGMAQVYGRENNSFKEEVALDRYYIEHYSPLLDIMIFIRTFFVVIGRVFRSEKPLAKNKKSI